MLQDNKQVVVSGLAITTYARSRNWLYAVQFAGVITSVCHHIKLLDDSSVSS